MLAYTDKDVAVPFTWIESDAKLIKNPQMVKLHSFDTKVSFVLFFIYFSPVKKILRKLFVLFVQIHKVDTLVSYKNDEWDEQ